MSVRNEETCHVDLAKPGECTRLLNTDCFCESPRAPGGGREGAEVSPTLPAYCVPASDWAPHAPTDTRSGDSPGEGPERGSQSRAVRPTRGLTGSQLRPWRNSPPGMIGSTAEPRKPDPSGPGPLPFFQDKSLVMLVSQLYLPSLLLFGPEHLSSC